jgi:hypothetical protein
MKETMKEYYQDNKEKIKEYHEANKEKIKEYKNEYYTDNKEKFKEYMELIKKKLKNIKKNIIKKIEKGNFRIKSKSRVNWSYDKFYMMIRNSYCNCKIELIENFPCNKWLPFGYLSVTFRLPFPPPLFMII